MAGIACPLTNTPQWKTLEKEYGDTMARILFAKNGYEVPSVEEAKALLSNKINTPADKQLNQQLSKFINALQGEIKNTDQIVINNKVYDAVAVTDIINRVISVVEGRAGKDTLPEEVGHLFVAYLPENSPLLAQMRQDIVNRPIFNDVYQEYKDSPLYQNEDGIVNEQKIMDEAIGKMIAKSIINQWDSQKEKTVWQKFWDGLWKWIKGVIETFKNKTQNARELEIHENMHTMDLGDLEGTKETPESQAYVEDMIRNHPNDPIANGESFNGFKNRILNNFKNIVNTVPDHTLMISNSTVLKLIDSWLKAGSPDDNSIDMEHFLKEETNPGERYEFLTHDGRKIYGMRHGETVDNSNNSKKAVSLQIKEISKESEQLMRQLNFREGPC